MTEHSEEQEKKKKKKKEEGYNGLGLPSWFSGKESACSTGDTASSPGSGRSPGGGNGNPLQSSCLGTPRDRGAWQESMELQRVDTTYQLNSTSTARGSGSASGQGTKLCGSPLQKSQHEQQNKNLAVLLFPLSYHVSPSMPFI